MILLLPLHTYIHLPNLSLPTWWVVQQSHGAKVPLDHAACEVLGILQLQRHAKGQQGSLRCKRRQRPGPASTRKTLRGAKAPTADLVSIYRFLGKLIAMASTLRAILFLGNYGDGETCADLYTLF